MWGLDELQIYLQFACAIGQNAMSRAACSAGRISTTRTELLMRINVMMPVYDWSRSRYAECPMIAQASVAKLGLKSQVVEMH
jgi:hypothetical protein